MIRLARLFARLQSDRRGVSVVEFGFIALPMCVLLMGGLDLGYQSYARSVMQGALNDAARRASVENPTISGTGATVEEKVQDYIRKMTGSIAKNATITVTQQSFFDFSNVGNPEKLMTDNNGNGEFDADDGDCWEDVNMNGEFDTDAGRDGRGGSNDVVFYTANVTMPHLFPLGSAAGFSDTIDMTLHTAVRNQPYSTQATPPVLCAEPAGTL